MPACGLSADHRTGSGATTVRFSRNPCTNDSQQVVITISGAATPTNVWRLDPGFGKTFVNLDNGALRFDGIKDIEATVKFVTESNLAEAGRIGIMGGSYGGYMVMAGLTDYPDLFAAGANDTNVPVVEAEQVVENLQERGVPVKYVLFPDEGHGWGKVENRVTSDVEIVRWFEEHL